jgi:hypothetical protein
VTPLPEWFKFQTSDTVNGWISALDNKSITQHAWDRWGATILSRRNMFRAVGLAGFAAESWATEPAGNAICGKWTYRSFINDPDPNTEFNKLKFPAWPNGIDQRPAIVGTIVRTVLATPSLRGSAGLCPPVPLKLTW